MVSDSLLYGASVYSANIFQVFILGAETIQGTGQIFKNTHKPIEACSKMSLLRKA